jgi:uncharacterized membrane protein
MKHRFVLFIFILLTTLTILFLTSAAANSTTSESDIESIIQWWAHAWWAVFIVGIFVIVIGIGLRGRTWASGIVTLGIIIIFVAVLLAEIAYLVIPGRIPILGLKVDITTCENIYKPLIEGSQKQDPIYDFVGMTACIISGYAPSTYSWLAITMFFIFGIIIPLAMLITLFYDFSGFLTNKNVRNVIALTGALLSFRALFSTFFIDFLTYGFGGIGLLFINYLFFGWAITWVRRMFAMVQITKTLLTVQDMAEYNRLVEYRDELIRARDILVRGGGSPDEIKKYDELIENVDKKIKELEGKIQNKEGKISPPYNIS